MKELYYQENILKLTRRLLDGFDQKKYNFIKNKTKQFKKLKGYISENYTNYTVSQAYLKMYEILETFKLLDLRKRKFRTFHFCEAPGQFIKSVEWYLKTKNKNNKLDWYAQSYNAKSLEDNTEGYFEDDYNLIRDNPERWLFGPDNSGDITKEEVVKSYKEVCQNAMLITSDCGLRSNTSYEMTYQDKKMAYIDYCQIIAILYNLPNKGNMVAKVFLPQSVNYIVSINYILANCFQEFYVYKPYLNPGSGEVYLIGKNYTRLDDKVLDKLFEIKDNLNIEKGFLKIDKTFLKEYQKCFIKFILSTLKVIKRNIFFYYNNLKFDNKKMNEIYFKNIDFWIKKFDFQKINVKLDQEIFL